jgi:hypothetical protein
MSDITDPYLAVLARAFEGTLVSVQSSSKPLRRWWRIDTKNQRLARSLEKLLMGDPVFVPVRVRERVHIFARPVVEDNVTVF